jgi:hypothetical protein
MGTQEKSLSQRKVNGLRRYPCDGQPRYAVKKGGSTTLLAYGEAYTEIFQLTGGTIDPKDGHQCFSREGIRRIMALNEAYLKVASTFVIAAMSVQNAQIASGIEAMTKAKTPVEEPGKVLTTIAAKADLSISYEPETKPDHEIQSERAQTNEVS